jgi:hypothetical protein
MNKTRNARAAVSKLSRLRTFSVQAVTRMREDDRFSRSILRSTKILAQNGAILRNAVRIPISRKTPANPLGTPKSVFDDFQAQLAANRTKFYYDVAAGPFCGFNRPGVKTIEASVWNWWRQGMMGGAKAHYDGIVAFSQTDFTEDLKKISQFALLNRRITGATTVADKKHPRPRKPEAFPRIELEKVPLGNQRRGFACVKHTLICCCRHKQPETTNSSFDFDIDDFITSPPLPERLHRG